MTGAIFLDRTDVNHRHLFAAEPACEFCLSNGLKLIRRLKEVVRDQFHLRHSHPGQVAERYVEARNLIPRQAVEDPCANFSSLNELGSLQDLKVG